MKKALDNLDVGVRVLVKAVCFVDDHASYDSQVTGRITMVNEWDKQSCQELWNDRGLTKIKKTKSMKISGVPGALKILVDGTPLEQVEEFKSLWGPWFQQIGMQKKTYNYMVAMAKNLFGKLKPILTGGLGNKRGRSWSRPWSGVWWHTPLKPELYENLIVRKLEAFELWQWRRIKRVRWTEEMTNAEVLALVKETSGLMGMIRRREHRWIGHVRHESLLQTTMEGWMEGKRPREQKGDDIRNERTYEEMKRRAGNREEWSVASWRTCVRQSISR